MKDDVVNWLIVTLPILDIKLSSCEVVQSRNDLEQSGFAASGRPHDADELAFLNLQADVTNGGKLSFHRAVDFLTTLTTDLYRQADLKKEEIIIIIQKP